MAYSWSNTMKRTAIIGFLFITLMAFGMAAPSDTSCCGPTCLMPAFMTCLQPPSEKGFEHPRGSAGMHRPNRKSNTTMSNDDIQFGKDRKITPNMVEHVMAVANEIDPDLAAQLETMCENDPDAFQKIIRRQGRRLRSLVSLRENDPELFEVKVAEFKTDAEIYRASETLRGQDKEAPEFQAKVVALQGLVRAKTALKLRAQTLYIGRLERHIDALRQELDDTTTRFDEIVDDRVEQLLNTVQNVKQDE